MPSYRHCLSLIDIIARVEDSTRKLGEFEAKVLHGRVGVILRRSRLPKDNFSGKPRRVLFQETKGIPLYLTYYYYHSKLADMVDIDTYNR